MRYFLFNLVFAFRGIPLRIFFQRVFVDGLEKIPKDKPILFIGNHTASFIDGGAVSYFTGVHAFPLARGDAFQKPIYNRLLRSLRILPIFRARDADPETAKAGNDQTYEACYRLFEQGEAVLIFPEASAEPEKNLRPLKKGAGNISANTLLRFDGEIDLHVVPVGINLSHFLGRRIRIQLGVGEPWSIQKHWDEIQEDPRLFGARITVAFEERLNELTVKTEKPDKANLELAHEMLLNECDPGKGFMVRHSGADLIAARLDGISRDKMERLQEYRVLLNQHQINDAAVQGRDVRLFSMLLCVLTAGVSLPATLLLQGIWMLAGWWARRSSPHPRFEDSIHLGIGFILTWFWYPLVALLLWAYLPDWHIGWKIAAFAMAIGMAPTWQAVFDELRQFGPRYRFGKMGSKARNRIRSLREEILSGL